MSDPARPEGPRGGAKPYSVAKLLALALLAFLAVVYFSYLSDLYDSPEPLHDSSGLLIGRDFIAFWGASDLALEGRAADLVDRAAFKAHYETNVGPLSLRQRDGSGRGYIWFYPPLSLLVITPLALLPYLWSYSLWIGLTLAAYLLAAARRGLARIELPVLLLSPATVFNFIIGQNGFLTAALLIGGLRLVERSPWLAGVLLGLLSFKPHLGLLVPVALAAGGHWRPFLGAGVTVLAMLAASVAMFGVDSWAAYFDTGLGLQGELLNELVGSSMGLAVAPVMSARAAGFDELTRNALYALLAAFAVWGVFTTYRNPRADAEMRITVVLAGVLLASPYGHSYDLTLVSVAVLWCFQRGLRDGFRNGELILLCAVWMLPFLAILLNTKGVPPGPPLLTVFFAFVVAKANGWLPRLAGPSFHGSRTGPGEAPRGLSE